VSIYSAPGPPRPSGHSRAGDSARPLTGIYTPLVGGEAVPVDLRVARIGSRAVAALIDLVIQLLVYGFLAGIVLATGIDVAAKRAFVILLLVLVFIGYPVILEAAWGGRTLGKAAMGLRAARDDGGPLRFRHALMRGLVGAFVEKPGVTLGIAAVVASLTSVRGKRLGDLTAGTVVLQVRLPTAGAYVPPMPPPLAGWATTLDLSRLPDGLALQARQFLARSPQLTADARERLGTSLVATVMSVVAPPPPPGTPGWAYLSAVLAERRRREEARKFAPPPIPQPAQPWPHGGQLAPPPPPYATPTPTPPAPPTPPPSNGFVLPG
jgi:uncharacterized RDD family membrane protein YckC